MATLSSCGRWTVVSILLPTALACELSPERARAKLADKGIAFTAEEFVRRAEKDPWSTLELFLRAGMDPNRKADVNASLEGVTALMVAAHAGRDDIAERLRKEGADINAQTRQGNSALMYAAAACRPRLVEALLRAGAQVDHENRRGETALLWAIPDTWPTEAPPCAGDCVNRLAAAGARINHRSHDDLTPLHAAIAKKQSRLGRLLLLRGADPNLRGDQFDITPLSHAVRNEEVEMVEALILAGANVREHGLLEWVSSSPRPQRRKVAEILLKAGAR